jgi:uncharacterized protein (TIGR03118 family)
MLRWIRRFGQITRSSRPSRQPSFRPTLEGLEERSLLDAGMTGFSATNLLSDLRGVAAHTSAALVNPWGFAETPQGQFQVAANGSGDTLHLNARGDVLGKPVVLQPPLGSVPGATTTPNGTALNTTSDFVIRDDGKSAPAQFIFSTEDGTIVGFNPKVDAKEGVLAAQSSDGAVYKLLAEASNAKGNFLFATDFHNNKIDVFDKNFDKVTLGQNGWGTFQDPNEPAGFAPFGIKEITVNGKNVLFVTYAKQDAAGHDDVAGAGNGFIDEFDTTGHFLQRFATGSAVGGNAPLNSPIGMTIAPSGFGPEGKFGGALLVGNFGDSHVSAFDLKTGQFLGQLSDAQGNPLTLNGGVGASGSKGLWGIAFGNGQGGTDPNALYFAAGINAENDGLFGKVTMSGDGQDSSGGNPTVHAAAAFRSFGVANGNTGMGDMGMFRSPPPAMSGGNGSTMSPSMTPMPALTPMANDLLVQRIDAFFQMYNADLKSLEASILAMHPQMSSQLSNFYQMYNAEVYAAEAAILGKL